MLEIQNVQIHTEWDELTPDEALQVIELLELLYKEVDVVEFRLRLLSILSGYKRSKKKRKPAEIEMINQNLAILADQFRFPTRYDYTEKERLSQLTPELRVKLRKYLPFEIFDSENYAEAQTCLDLIPSLRIDLSWHRNLVPEFEWLGVKLLGPVIDIDNYGLINTSITAGEYVDALGYFNAFLDTKNDKFLIDMLAVLYRIEGAEYGEKFFTYNKRHLSDVPIKYKKLAFYLIQNLTDFLTNRSGYTFLFSRTKNNDGSEKISLGAESTIFDLVKAGYGSDEEIRKKNLVVYLNMQVDKLKSFVSECRAYKMKDTEIASKYHIPINTLKLL
ncbi:MAG: hypothetical protein PF448_13105 [Bacteroidales bacterium]|jgi:hypothetical protein|nr:hypothetical protein [Bacteroidales bacterium]